MSAEIAQSTRVNLPEAIFGKMLILIKILAIISVAEFGTMILINRLGIQPGLPQYITDVILLSAISAPFLFYWIVRERTSKESAEKNLLSSETKLHDFRRESLNSQTALNSILKISLENISLHEKLEKTLKTLFALPWLAIESKGAIFVTEKTGGVLSMKVQCGLSDPLLVACARVPFGKCLCGKAALSAKPVFAAHVDERHDVKYDAMPPHGHYCLPITIDGKVHGVLNLYLKDGSARSNSDETFLVSVTDTIGGMIQRTKIEEQLHQAQKMEAVGRLAGGIAHDFNNLLTAILGGGTFLLKNLDQSDPNRKDVEEIITAGKRAADLTRQLLIFSRRQVVEPRIINLNELILGIDKMLRRVIGEDIELVTLPGGDIKSVKADTGQIEQVIMNLSANARDAMPKGGKLTIETANVSLGEDYTRAHPEAPAGEYVMLAVSDTGVGMTAEVQTHLFEPFFTTKEPGRGTGLGLATCYSIVKQSGGHMTVYSEVDRGTTFKIYLPHREGTATTLSKATQPRILPRGSEMILLVEDDHSIRRMAARILRQQGYTVLEAATGDEALLKVQEQPKDSLHLLITDIIMPKMNGKELAQIVQQHCSKAKVLYISGYTQNVVVHHGILDPGIYFLQKPFTYEDFACKVREVMDSSD